MSQTRFEAIFKAAGVDGFVHARDLSTGDELGYRSDTAVVTASVFKVPVLVELFRQSDAGLLDLGEPITVPMAGRAWGQTGLSVMLDSVTMSWRDLALSMIVVSDNAATDVICARLGLGKVNAMLRALGLPGTAVDFDCRALFAQMAQDAGVADLARFPAPPDEALLCKLRVLRAAATNRSTPREISRLFEMIWTDRAASPDSCEQMRRILGAQVWPHRLASGFPEDHLKTAGKTGTLLTVRNEAGVVSDGAGRHVAISVFTRSQQSRIKHPAQDAAIGTAARLAFDLLMSDEHRDRAENSA